MLRTRFKKDIVAEFLPPSQSGKLQKVIILCDGMPSIPRKQPLMEFLSRKGYWVFYPRYRGAWESGGRFLERSPHEDILHVIGALAKPFTDTAFGQRYRISAEDFFVIGGSFGGATSILSTLDRRVKKAVANCPVVDWSILSSSEKAETSNPNYAAYIREAFGNAYRLSDRNWKKLRSGTFFSPMHHLREIDSSKILMFHAKDDPLRSLSERTAVCRTCRDKTERVSSRRTPENGIRRAAILAVDKEFLRIMSQNHTAIAEVAPSTEVRAYR